jgi:hypothetical protein
VIYSSICFLGLSQHNYSEDGVNLLDLVFPNSADFTIYRAEYGIVQSDHYHPPNITDCIMPIRHSKHTVNIPFNRYSAGDYLLLCDALSNYDLTPLYKVSSVDADVDRLNAVVTEAMDLAVPFGLMRKNKYPYWFSGKFKFF